MYLIFASGNIVIDCRPPGYIPEELAQFDVYESPEPAWPGQPVPASAMLATPGQPPTVPQNLAAAAEAEETAS